MRIVYHLGVHCTDEDRLVRCLLKNRSTLSDQGIAVPSPTRYRNLLRDAAKQLRGARASAESAAIILDQITDDPQAERVILSWTSFLSFPAYAVGDGLYGQAGDRLHGFTQVFSEMDAEFHMAIRNPASFLPDLRERVMSKGFDDILRDIDATQLRWSDTIRAIKDANPGVPMIVWCDEDTPLIWPEVLQAISGHAPDTALEDDEELLADLMTEEGLVRYRAYCREHPPQTVSQRRRIVTAFLEKFGRPEKMSTQATAPGWSEALVDRLTQNYWRDLDRIARTPGVRIIEP